MVRLVVVVVVIVVVVVLILIVLIAGNSCGEFGSIVVEGSAVVLVEIAVV